LHQTFEARAALSPELSIVIPVYNNAGTLRHCLEALQNAPGPTREILVVDDGSNDGSLEVARSFGVRTISHCGNHGADVARNTGAEHAAAPVLVFVDSDVVIHRDALLRVSDFMSKNQNYAAVFGSYDAKPSDPGFVSQYRNLLHHFTHQEGSPEAQTFWTGLGAVRRQAFRDVGGFNLRYGGIEDVTFGVDLSSAGFRIRLDRDLLCTHLKKWTFRTMVLTDILLRAVPWSAMILDRRAVTNDLNTSSGKRFAVALATATSGFLVMAALVPAFALLSLLSLLGMLVLNAPLLEQFRRERGPLFALSVIPLHFMHQLCAATGVAFALMLEVFGAGKLVSDRTPLELRTEATLLEQQFDTGLAVQYRSRCLTVAGEDSYGGRRAGEAWRKIDAWANMTARRG
jgi:cellulose synthase/poly-beta-1,6-N-acetylglucosamine synthase-like glycosyltransferase